MDLREELNQIIKQKEEADKASEILKLRLKEAEYEKAKIEAKSILETLPEKAKEVARTSNSRQLQVYKIERFISHSNAPQVNEKLKLEKGANTKALAQFLNLKEVLIIEGILEFGLIAELSYDHDGVGINSWYSINAKW